MTNQPITSLSSEMAKILVCVDKVEQAELRGYIHSPFLEEPVAYFGVMDLINQVEQLLDRWAFPIPSVEYRKFDTKQQRPVHQKRPELHRYHEDDIFKSCRGVIATYTIQVRFRHNACWQGRLCNLSDGQPMTFRSILELIQMLGNAFLPPREDANPGWEEESPA